MVVTNPQILLGSWQQGCVVYVEEEGRVKFGVLMAPICTRIISPFFKPALSPPTGHQEAYTELSRKYFYLHLSGLLIPTHPPPIGCSAHFVSMSYFVMDYCTHCFSKKYTKIVEKCTISGRELNGKQMKLCNSSLSLCLILLGLITRWQQTDALYKCMCNEIG